MEREAILELCQVVRQLADVLVLALGRARADEVDNKLDAIEAAMEAA